MRGISQLGVQNCFPKPQVLAQKQNHSSSSRAEPRTADLCDQYLHFTCPDTFLGFIAMMQKPCEGHTSHRQTSIPLPLLPPPQITQLCSRPRQMHSIIHNYSNLIYVNNFQSISIANAAGGAVHSLEEGVNSNQTTTNFIVICYC